MDTNDTSPSRKRRGIVAAVAAAVAIAVALPVSGALAGEGSGSGSGSGAPGLLQVQEGSPGDRQAPDRGDCPEKDRGQGQDGEQTTPRAVEL